jgi:hypothetical protein
MLLASSKGDNYVQLTETKTGDYHYFTVVAMAAAEYD